LVSGILFGRMMLVYLLDRNNWIGQNLQEPGEEEGEETGCGEEKECAIACLSHGGEHVWDCSSNNKVE
jgi:hypothetical protein